MAPFSSYQVSQEVVFREGGTFRDVPKSSGWLEMPNANHQLKVGLLHNLEILFMLPLILSRNMLIAILPTQFLDSNSTSIKSYGINFQKSNNYQLIEKAGRLILSKEIRNLDI